MPRRYTELLFTPTVVEAQVQAGVRQSAERMQATGDTGTELTAAEAAFIAARDSFYMASISEGGWPYMQHRGGPPGFLKVLDSRTLAFADFRGNQQLLTTGNVSHDDRVSLFFMDYPGRTRLKLLAHASITSPAESPDTLALVEDPHYRARIERIFVFRVEAFDWNCPQHITPRWTEAELAARSKA